MAQLHALINHCKAFAVGSPTLNRDAVPPVWNLLAGADAINSGKKPALVFGSYGPEPVRQSATSRLVFRD